MDNKLKPEQDRDNVTKPVIGQNFADKKNLKQDDSEIETEEGLETDEDIVETDDKH